MLMKALLLGLLLCLVSYHAHALSKSEELEYRVRFSSPEDVKLLLDKGADPNKLNDIGLPLVSVAAGRKDNDAVPVLRTLVDAGADVNEGGRNNQYPIIIAARENNLLMVRYLLYNTDVDVTVRDLNGLLPVEIADYYGSEKVKGLIKHITDKRLKEEAERVGPARRDRLITELANYFCTYQYNYYYHKSGQSGLPKKEVEEIIKKSREEGEAQIKELYTTFNFPYERAVEMKTAIGSPITSELDAMISNRQRAKNGVGTPEDMKKRCAPVVNSWLKEYFKDMALREEHDLL
jgi:Ankyrin repeats (many copies)